MSHSPPTIHQPNNNSNNRQNQEFNNENTSNLPTVSNSALEKQTKMSSERITMDIDPNNGYSSDIKNHQNLVSSLNNYSDDIYSNGTSILSTADHTSSNCLRINEEKKMTDDTDSLALNSKQQHVSLLSNVLLRELHAEDSQLRNINFRKKKDSIKQIAHPEIQLNIRNVPSNYHAIDSFNDSSDVSSFESFKQKTIGCSENVSHSSSNNTSCEFDGGFDDENENPSISFPSSDALITESNIFQFADEGDQLIFKTNSLSNSEILSADKSKYLNSVDFGGKVISSFGCADCNNYNFHTKFDQAVDTNLTKFITSECGSSISQPIPEYRTSNLTDSFNLTSSQSELQPFVNSNRTMLPFVPEYPPTFHDASEEKHDSFSFLMKSNVGSNEVYNESIPSNYPILSEASSLFDIKHRKRTSREQLQVLERTFAENQRPTSEQRKELALMLDMTPRGVQIWFQNRRAKLKSKTRDEEHFQTLRRTRESLKLTQEISLDTNYQNHSNTVIDPFLTNSIQNDLLIDSNSANNHYASSANNLYYDSCNRESTTLPLNASATINSSMLNASGMESSKFSQSNSTIPNYSAIASYSEANNSARLQRPSGQNSADGTLFNSSDKPSTQAMIKPIKYEAGVAQNNLPQDLRAQHPIGFSTSYHLVPNAYINTANGAQAINLNNFQSITLGNSQTVNSSNMQILNSNNTASASSNNAPSSNTLPVNMQSANHLQNNSQHKNLQLNQPQYIARRVQSNVPITLSNSISSVPLHTVPVQFQNHSNPYVVQPPSQPLIRTNFQQPFCTLQPASFNSQFLKYPVVWRNEDKNDKKESSRQHSMQDVTSYNKIPFSAMPLNAPTHIAQPVFVIPNDSFSRILHNPSAAKNQNSFLVSHFFNASQSANISGSGMNDIEEAILNNRFDLIAQQPSFNQSDDKNECENSGKNENCTTPYESQNINELTTKNENSTSQNNSNQELSMTSKEIYNEESTTKKSNDQLLLSEYFDY